MSSNQLISVVVPCYNEQETVPIFFKTMEEINAKMPDHTINYFFVDDGSKDNTLAEMRQLNAQNPDRSIT